MNATNIEQVLARIAPWPDTADTSNMARWFTARAFVNFARLNHHPYLRSTPEHDADQHRHAAQDFARDCELAWTQYAAAYLLREAGPCGLSADRITEALRRDADSGELAAETLADWLDEYGINPELILAALLGPAGIQATNTGGTR